MKKVIFFGFVICFALGKVSTAEVRLVGGPTLYQGRLEVRKSNSDPWGTVCDDQFDNADASVVCRMLGFDNTESSSIIDPNRFGPGSGKILLDEMKCIGNESDVSECKANEWGESDCGHTEDVGVSCLTPARLKDGLPPHSGRVEIQRKGSWESICYDGVNQNTAKVLCRMMALSTGDVEITPNDSKKNISTSKFSCNGTEKDILQCHLSESQCQTARSTSINCRTDVRLAGGPNQQEGRVEIYFQDKWGTVCDDSFDDNAASVVCRMLGFSPNGARARGRHFYGQGNGSIVIDNLRCSGNEADISECKSNMWGSHTNCDHKEDVSVDCGTEVRLADGPTRYSGRIEIKSKSSWDNMCEDSFDNNTGLVICKMLGFERGNLTIHKNAYYGNGAGDMVKYKLKCHGNETDIVNCRHDPISSCTGNSNVGINCYSVTPIRLQGGPTTYSGRVEVYLKEQSIWVGICNENYGFTIDDARVLCRMLGKPNMNPSFQDATSIYDYVIRGEAIYGMNCSGSEQDITDCVSDQRWLETSCNYPNYVGINCEPKTNVRLVDGPSVKAGRVEILYNGTWGGVCADGFDIKDSDVVCNMLGYTQKSYLLQNDEFLQGNISTLVTNVQCKGHERDISDCRSERWTSGHCRSGINVGIACNSIVRLVNGTSERSGIVEIYHRQKWWAMCSDSIDENVADVVCRMAGFRYWNASVLEGSSFRKDARDFLINQITCNGSESDLASCHTSPWKNTSCSSGLAATVDCKIPHTLIRLVGGKTRYSGRVNVFHNNKWGTICASPFSDENAQIVCLTLGYNFTSDITYSYYMYENEYNNVMISNMKCSGNETDISVCPSDYWDTGNGNCTSSYQSVGINCLTTVRLQGGRTNAIGRVEVKHRGSFSTQYGTICKDNFAETNIPVICSMLGFNYTKKYSPVSNEFHNGSIPKNLIRNLQCNGDEKDLQQCNSSSWEFGTNCSDINTASISCNTPIRLAGGKSWRSGRLELLFQENWIDVCHVDNSSSLKISKVICRMMGVSTRTIKVFQTVGNSSTSGNISCTGNEQDISLCSILKLKRCSTSKRLGILCETQIKLVQGRTDYMGIVSFYIDGRSEAISNFGNNLAADVVCKILGYNFTRFNQVQTSSELRSHSTCYYRTLTNLNCNGNETDIYDCKDSVWNSESSCYSTYLGVNCQSPIRLTNGREFQYGQLEVKENVTWVPVCSEGFDLENAHVVCRMLGHKHVENTTYFGEALRQGRFVSGDIQCNGSEVDISECKHHWIDTNCSHSGVVTVECRSQVRLQGGPTKFKGRVEVLYKGKWGSICGYKQTYNAKVICKMLGYNYAGAIVHSGRAFSNKSAISEYTIQNLNCVGTEDDITECSSSEWKNGLNCNDMPLEIECNTPVYLQFGSNENIGYVYVKYQQTSRGICGDNFTQNEADVICRKIGSETYQNATIYYGNKFGYSYYPINELKCVGGEVDLQECNSLPWNETSKSLCNSSNTAVSVNCRPMTPIRLTGSHDSGIVEINYQNIWGQICYNNFDIKDASVLCNMLGFKIGYPGIPIDTTDDATIYNLQCDGTESDVSECTSSTWYSKSYSCPETVQGENLKATVTCSNDRVRLRNGVNEYQGRVEFQSIGIWGTVCDNKFNRLDAETVCRQIGFPSEKTATLYNSTRFGNLNSNLVVDEMKCTGTENDLDECGSYPWAANSYICPSGHMDAGVNCRPVTPLKLVNATNKYSGRVEIEYKGSYGTICDRGFDENEAKVICRMKGFNPLSTIARKHAFYGAGSGRIIISDLQCNGDENDISECKTEYNYRWDNPYPYCTHAHDVSVQCNTPVRLRGGWTLYDGIVEIYINGSWTSVCHSGFTQVDAQTVCQLAGLNKNGTRPHNVTILKGQYFGMKGTPTVGRLNCTGNEDDLYNCGTSKWTTEQYSCNPRNIAAINCQPVTKIRLMDGESEVKRPTKETDNMKGRVEVFYNNEWGTVCDDQFDDSDAQVLCNMLGFPFGKVVKQTGYCKENKCGNILIDDLNCLGIERDISECNAREWGTHNCDHSEDVSIRCYSKVIDPCNASENVRLPNLELRYVNIDTTHLPKSINDSKLPFRWYNVGNNTMPIKLDSNNRCGTHLPIYSSFSVERIGTNKTAKFKAVEVGNTDVSYNIEMKNCGDQFYVYKLRPTGSEESGYCFGVGSKETAPTFVPPSVSVSLVSSNHTVSFKCKFDPYAKEDFYYQVHWRVEDSSIKVLTKQFFKKDNLDGLKLTEDDFLTNDIGLGINISCAVRAFRSRDGLPGTLSSYSKASFFGIEVRTPYISLRNGETKSIELINYVPIICHTGNVELDKLFNQGKCDVRLQYFSPQYGTCSDGPSFKGGCDVLISNKDVGNIIHVNISSAEKGQYGVAGHFKVYLYVAPKNDPSYMKLWIKTYKLPVINVDVLPEEQTDWRGAICSARNDPHMYTFDQRAYEHHEQSGEYILYRHKIYKTVEIQHKIAPCTGDDQSAQCNCGLAVRAGRDVYVINVCDNLLVIGLTHCGDEALTIKKENDFTYTIYLPFGTAVRARIDNQPFAGHEGGKVLDINILPSVHDKGGNSIGLCGTLNNNTRDDFHHKNETIGTINNRTEFIRSWKVLPNESLFSLQAVNARDLEPWVFPMCTCASETSNPLSCNRSVSECTPGIRTGQHSCGEVSSRRSVRSLTKRPIIPIVRRTDHYARQHRIIRRESDERSWNREKATIHCREYFSNLKAFELCQKIPSTHTNISEENCILDILLTNSSKWTSISKQSMLDTCQTEIHRNASVRQVLIEKAKNATIAANTNLNIGTTLLPPSEINAIEQVEQIIKDITELSCLNNCSGNGACKNGTCSCNKGFGATDCSLDINKPPRLQTILDNGLCDENVSDCTHIYLFGEVFVGTNLTCKLQEFKMAVNETRKNTKVFHIKGIAESLIEAMCPIAHISTSRKRRSVTGQSGSQVDFVHGYEVSISNDGLNYGNKTLDVYVFDSTCQTYNNKSVGMTFELKDGFCHIEGKCVQNGTLSMHQTMMCDTRMNKFNWTLKQTTTTERVTPPTTTYSFKTVNLNKTIAEIVKSEPDLAAYKIELTIDVKLDSSHDISIPNIYDKVLNETKTSLMKYYRETLGLGLKDVVIISLKSGSLIVKHAVIAKTDDFVIKAFTFALTGLSNGKQIELFGNPHSVSNVKIEDRKVGVESEHFQDFLLCESYTQLQQCMDHEECVVVQGAATCKKISQEESEGNTNMIIIISSTVGGVLVIVIFALVTVLCCKRKKNKNGLKKRRQTTVQNEYDGMPLESLSKSDDRGKKQGHDNRAYKGESKDSAVDDMTLGSGSVYNDGSYVESKDGYIYYYGKSKPEDRL